MKNDNLNIVFSAGGYRFTILKFSYECLPGNMPSHAHSSNSYEIHFIPKGKGTLLSGQKKFDLFPSVLYTTGPNVDHAQFSDPKDPMYEYCIYMKVIKETKSGQAEKDSGALQKFLGYSFWYGTDRTDIQDVLQRIYSEFSNPGPAASLLLRALFIEFVVSVLRNYDNSSQATIVSLPVPLVKAYILIEDSFLYEYRTITMEELSNRLGLSVRQTSRILYKQYGQNFTQKRTEARMAAAAAFLQENRLSVTEISQRVGYSSHNHFCAAFKKYFHMTVSQYRTVHVSSRGKQYTAI